jgi:hypothetical protein
MCERCSCSKRYDLGRTDEPVAEIVPNTEPIATTRSKSFCLGELTEFDFERPIRSFRAAAPDVRATRDCSTR